MLSTDKRSIVIFLAAIEDAWLKLHKEVLSAVVVQNKRLIAIIKKQKEYVTKQDLQMLKDKIAEKITRAVPAIARKLMDDIKERQACDDELVAKLVRDLKEQICQFVESLEVKHEKYIRIIQLTVVTITN